MAELSREQFYEKYGRIEVKFNSYYKFDFIFVGETPEGYKISVSYGGNAEEIYRYELSYNQTGTVESIEPYTGVVYDKTGRDVDSFYAW